MGLTSSATFFAGHPSFRFISIGLPSDVLGAFDGAGASAAAHSCSSTISLVILVVRVVLVALGAALGGALGWAFAVALGALVVLCSDFVNRVLRRGASGSAGAGSVRPAF